MASKIKTPVQILYSKMSARPHHDELWETICRFDKQDFAIESHDRACALVLGAILEQGLETAILSHCIPMAESERIVFWGGATGEGSFSFSLKIRLAHALGIYGSESLHDLNAIRTIRNTFAHTNTNLSFNDKAIGDLLGNLLSVKKLLKTNYFVGMKADNKSVFTAITRHFYAYLILESEKGPVNFRTYEFGELFS